jgi:DNA-binding transcriptional ArsR family regulator
MDAAWQALVEPRRRDILGVLGGGELSAGEIAEHFDVTRPAISQHLAVLRAAGLVSERRDGTRRMYRARPEGAEELRAWLDTFWLGALDRLKLEAEREARRAR